MDTQDKWIDRAALLGATVATNMYRFWAKNPKDWPSFKQMKRIVVSMAEDQVFIQMPTRVRSREEVLEAARTSAAHTADAFNEVHRAARKTSREPSKPSKNPNP